jgi:hypothetical protein
MPPTSTVRVACSASNSGNLSPDWTRIAPCNQGRGTQTRRGPQRKHPNHGDRRRKGGVRTHAPAQTPSSFCGLLAQRAQPPGGGVPSALPSCLHPEADTAAPRLRTPHAADPAGCVKAGARAWGCRRARACSTQARRRRPGGTLRQQRPTEGQQRQQRPLSCAAPTRELCAPPARLG